MLQTLKGPPSLSGTTPGIYTAVAEHPLHITLPQHLQWCGRLIRVKVVLQLEQLPSISLGIMKLAVESAPAPTTEDLLETSRERLDPAGTNGPPGGGARGAFI
jgi:hypothetical protein